MKARACQTGLLEKFLDVIDAHSFQIALRILERWAHRSLRITASP